jgi:hypothetical protein
MDRPPLLPILDESFLAEVFLPLPDESLPSGDATFVIESPLPTTPTVLESDTEGENVDDLIYNISTFGTLDTLQDLEDYGGVPERMNGGSVYVASRRRSRSPTPRPEPGAIRRLGPVPDVLAHYSGVTTFSWAAAGVGAAFREALTRAPLSAAVPFQISPDMTVCLCPPGGDVCDHALDQVRPLWQAGWSYYVGITEHPSRRWAEHREQNAHWDEMRVVVMAETSRDTAMVERFVLFHCRMGLGCMNIGPGGERASSGSPHFVYVIFSRSGLIRRSGRR